MGPKKDKVTRQGLNFEPPCVGDITANGETAVLGLGNGSLAVLNLGEGSFTTVGGVSTAAAMDAIADPQGSSPSHRTSTVRSCVGAASTEGADFGAAGPGCGSVHHELGNREAGARFGTGTVVWPGDWR